MTDQEIRDLQAEINLQRSAATSEGIRIVVIPNPFHGESKWR